MHDWVRLWAGQPEEVRREAALAFWMHSAEEGENAAEAIAFLADSFHLRPKTVVGLPAAKKAEFLARKRSVPPNTALRALMRLHLHPRSPMLVAFLDRLGVPHEGGSIDRKESTPQPIPEARLREAIEALRASFPKEQVDLYLAMLEEEGSLRWSHLPAARAAAAPPGGPAPRGEPEEEAEEPARGAHFSSLDLLARRAIVASVARDEGALDDVQVRDAIEDLVHLNQARHRSYFHLGLLDSLQGRPPETNWPQSSPDRRAWYLCGALDALLGRARGDEARALVQGHPAEFKLLGRGEHEASAVAIPLLFDAIWSGPEPLSVLAWLKPSGLRLSPETILRALDAATGLLREARGEEARRLLDLAAEAAALRGREGAAMPRSFLRDLSRRRAHCLRLSGDFEGAASILEPLAGAEESDGKRGMILADLGLIACRLRSIADVRVPPSRDDWPAGERALAPGEERFRQAVGMRGGHGEFCLGTLLLLRGRDGEARPLLERAVAEMQARAEIYNANGALPRARLCLAYTLAEQVDPANPGHVLRLTRDSLERDAKGPHHLYGRILFNLSLVDPPSAADLARDLLRRVGARMLDAVGEAQLLRAIPEARNALLARSREPGRSRADRFDDRLRALQASLRGNDRATAEEALDLLEELSGRDPEQGRFLDLLSDPDARGDIWTEEEIDESRVRIYEEKGDTLSAATILEGMGHRLLTRGGEHNALVVLGIADRIRGYGLEPDPRLLKRAEAGGEPAPSPPTAARGSILFIGGNELQRKIAQGVEEAVRRRWPAVSVRFEHPAWSSNWAKQFESLRNPIAGADAVVLMPLVRTQFGRAVRKACGEAQIPWIPCTSRGASGMERAIEYAIRLVAGS